VTCGGGTQSQSFTETTAARYGGESCPASPKTRDCNTEGCPVSVVMKEKKEETVCLICRGQVNCSGEWSAWNSCNASSCGEGVELRYFQPRQLAAFGGDACPASPESRPCTDTYECPVRHVFLA